ncbi:hypothetical protein K488DRAFT_75304, partial [Vararia minispora EC-137]
MRAQFKKEWKTGLGEEDGAGDGKDDGGDVFAQDDGDDGDDEDGEDAGSDSDDEGDDKGDGAEGRKKQRQRLAQEELFLARKLEAASAEVKAEIEQRASAEYEERVAERRAWLEEGPKTFEEAAAMMRVFGPLFENLVSWLAERGAYSAWYVAAPGDAPDGSISVHSFMGGASPLPGSSASAPRKTFDDFDPLGHADICERIHGHALQGLPEQFLRPSDWTENQTSEASSPPAMGLGDEDEPGDLLSDRDTTLTGWLSEQPGSLTLMVPQRGEDESSEDGSDMYWPGE